MNTRNTKQREIILDTLQHMYNHPTILELYDQIKKVDASIGQATVYRNISKLVDQGMVQRISTNNGVDRYDGNVIPHYHFMCQNCHKLYDLYDDKFKDMVEMLIRRSQMKVVCVNLFVEGICFDCISSSLH